MKQFSLAEKTILITGASSGIGRVCALAAAAAGARVIASGRNAERLDETLAALPGEGHQVLAVDLASEEACQELLKTLPALDGAVFAAGINKIKPAKFLKAADVAEMMRVNFEAPFALTCGLLKARKFKEQGSCVFIGSIASRFTAVGNAAYAASKGALLSGVRTLALESAKQGVRMNVVAPGQVVTPLMTSTAGEVSAEVFAKNEALYPLGYGQPEDIGNAAVFLLSAASRWITGQELVMDGGFTLV